MSATDFGVPVHGGDLALGGHAVRRWYECGGSEPGRVFLAQDDAVRWLQSVVVGPGGTLDIRRVLASCGDDLALCRTDDQAAVAQLAALLVSGRIRVCGDLADAGMQLPEAQWPSAVAAPAASTAVPIGSVVAPSSRPAQAPAPAQEKPEVEVDVAAMVATLRAAAKDGVPFCEECARAQQQAA